jgi:hypothetical protein
MYLFREISKPNIGYKHNSNYFKNRIDPRNVGGFVFTGSDMPLSAGSPTPAPPISMLS